jgi:hypothetical protein
MFYQKITFVMALITKLFKKIKMFKWTTECQTTWENIKNQYFQTLVFIGLNWELEFHVHIDASQLTIRVILAHILIGKIDKLILYSSRLLNFAKKNYTITQKKVLAMVYALHKFMHYMLGNKFTFYVDHMALVYLVNKP